MMLTAHQRAQAIAHTLRIKTRAERQGRWELADLYARKIEELKAGGTGHEGSNLETGSR